MPTPRRKRTLLKPDRVRALELLAGYGAEGCTKAMLRANGFATGEIVELVRGGLATATADSGPAHALPTWGYAKLPLERAISRRPRRRG